MTAGTIANTNAAALCPATGCAVATAPAPALTTWNNGGGGTPLSPRVMLGVVIADPFMYMTGGATGSGTTAVASTEQAVWWHQRYSHGHSDWM